MGCPNHCYTYSKHNYHSWGSETIAEKGWEIIIIIGTEHVLQDSVFCMWHGVTLTKSQ